MIYRVPNIPLLIPEKVFAMSFKLDHRITVVLNDFGTEKVYKFLSIQNQDYIGYVKQFKRDRYQDRKFLFKA